MIIADTSGLLALWNNRESSHETVVETLSKLDDPLVVSPYVIAEVDYLLATRAGIEAELSVLHELAGGAFVLAEFGQQDIAIAAKVIRRYADQHIGLADASIVVLADRFSTRRILTLDRRHFDVLRPLSGSRFAVLPE